MVSTHQRPALVSLRPLCLHAPKIASRVAFDPKHAATKQASDSMRCFRKPPTAMNDHIRINLQNWEERASIHARDTTGDYMLDQFRAGEDALHAIEAAELGDISGKRVLHRNAISVETHSVWPDAERPSPGWIFPIPL